MSGQGLLVSSSWWLLLLLLLKYTACTLSDINVQTGEQLIIDLPGYDDCGQYALLDPSLELVLILSGANSSSTFGQYIERAEVDVTAFGVMLIVQKARDDDGGIYKIATSSREGCQDLSYSVHVHVGAEHLHPWSDWTECSVNCDPSHTRARERNCSVPGGCGNLGPQNEEDSCDRAEHCPHWTKWSQWGSCSAKCGKGFKIRKRICLAGTATLLDTSRCTGESTQSNLCMVVCEVVGMWTDWSEWGQCSSGCGPGTRSRHRECGGDPRVTQKDCLGDKTITESCHGQECAETSSSPKSTRKPEVTTTGNSTNIANGNQVDPVVAEENDFLNYFILGGIVCLLLVILVLIVFCVLKRRSNRARRASEEILPEVQTREKKISKTSRTDIAPPKAERANVYSEMGSSFCYDSSEFDSSRRNTETSIPVNSIIQNIINEEWMNQSFDSDEYYNDSEFEDDFDFRQSRYEREEAFVTLGEKEVYRLAQDNASEVTGDDTGIDTNKNNVVNKEDVAVKKNVTFSEELSYEQENRLNEEHNEENPDNSETPDVVVNDPEQMVVEEDLVEKMSSEVITCVPDQKLMEGKPTEFTKTDQKKDMSEVETPISDEVSMKTHNETKASLAKENEAMQETPGEDHLEINTERISKEIDELLTNLGYKSETIYENCEIVNGVIQRAEITGLEEKQLMKINSNASIETLNTDSEQELDKISEGEIRIQSGESHLYYNDKVNPGIKDFYVTPKKKRSIKKDKQRVISDHIYDVPRFK